jgi:HEAT repeat protein
MVDRSGASSPKADWYADPTGRHQYRYWDGVAWMDVVADEGQQSADPLRVESRSAYPADPRVAQLIGDLTNKDPKIVLLAADSIKKMGKVAVEPLIATLQDPKPAMRSWAACLLRDIPDERAVGPLIAALDDGEARVCINALKTLGELQDPRAIDPLLLCLKNPNPGIRCDAAAALGHFCSANVVDALLSGLSDVDRSVRGEAAVSLGKLEEPRATEPITRLLEEETDTYTRQNLAEALSALADAPSAPTSGRSSTDSEQPAPTTTVASSLASLENTRAKQGAVAAVMNSTGVAILAPGSSSDDAVNEDMVRRWIDQDLERRPELRAQAAAIEEIAILTNVDISPLTYAEDMMNCYVAQMDANNWATPEDLHVFEAYMGPVTVYIAYGT